MSRKHLVITGGSGFVGTELSKRAVALGYRVTILDISYPKIESPLLNFIKVDLLKESVPEEICTADVIVHLMGVSVFNRWTESYKKLIYDSRILTAEKLFNFFKDKEHKPKVFISASAIGIYGSRSDEILDEDSALGSDFLARVCVDWEKTASRFTEYGSRVVSVRTGIVLRKGGGMLAKVMPLFKLGLGGRMGSGKQWFSFISMTDLIRLYEAALDDARLSGPINAVAPNPVQNKDLAIALGKSLNMPAFLPAPAFLLRLVLGEFAEVVLSSQRVLPKKLSSISFKYSSPNIIEALR